MNPITRFSVGICLAAVALFSIPAVQAGERREEKKHPGMEYFEGKIISTDAKTKTVVIEKKGGNMTFQIAPDCKFYLKREKNATFDNFKVGDKVEVLYKNVNGAWTASQLAEKGANPDRQERKNK